MTQVSGAWMTDPGTQKVMGLLADAGHQVFFVGGCVRDSLLGRPVADIDIATDAHPNRVAELAKSAGLKVIPTGIDHGTLTLISGRPFEVTTFRRDVTTDGRRAKVAFSMDLAQDAHRRDLTINGLYADRDGVVTDLVGGVADLENRILRFIGDAQDRIVEDHLRALRYFRFYAWFGDPGQGPDAGALAAIAENLIGLGSVSKERVGAEVLKLLSAPNPYAALCLMDQSGALNTILPGADPKAIGPLVEFERDLLPDPIRRLAALTGDNPSDALRLSRDQSRNWTALSRAARAVMGAGEAGYRLGEKRGYDAVLVAAALIEQPLTGAERAAVDSGAASVFPVRAADLAPLTGPLLGARLKELESQWIASAFTLTKAALLA